MRDLDRQRKDFDRDFAAEERRLHLLQLLAIPITLAFALLVLSLLAVGVWALIQAVGLV
jgi:hypothetical protein